MTQRGGGAGWRSTIFLYSFSASSIARALLLDPVLDLGVDVLEHVLARPRALVLGELDLLDLLALLLREEEERLADRGERLGRAPDLRRRRRRLLDLLHAPRPGPSTRPRTLLYSGAALDACVELDEDAAEQRVRLDLDVDGRVPVDQAHARW